MNDPENIVPKERLFWCNSHSREATHVVNGQPCCDPSIGGILLPCDAVEISGEGDFQVKCPSDQSVAGIHCFGRFVRGVPVESGLVAVTCKFCGISETDIEEQCPLDDHEGKVKLFDCQTNHRVMGQMQENGGPSEVFVEPIVSQTEARATAATLLGLELCFVKVRQLRGCWITATVPGGNQYHWRGATWFAALEAIHKFLIDAVVHEEQSSES